MDVAIHLALRTRVVVGIEPVYVSPMQTNYTLKEHLLPAGHHLGRCDSIRRVKCTAYSAELLIIYPTQRVD